MTSFGTVIAPPASSTDAKIVRVALLEPHMQIAGAGTAPIAPDVSVQLGEGVALTVTVGVGVVVGVTEGDAAGVGVTEGLAPGVIVGEADGEDPIGAVPINAVGVPQEEPSAPDGRVHG